NGYVYYDTPPFSNDRTPKYSSTNYRDFYHIASRSNSGTVDFQGDGGFYIGSGNPSVTNSGTIKKSAGTGQGGMQVSLIAQSGSQIGRASGRERVEMWGATGASTKKAT